jgi:hypothetical protein
MKGGDLIIGLPNLSEKLSELFLPLPTKPSSKKTIKSILKSFFEKSNSSIFYSFFDKVLNCMTGYLGFHANVCDNCAKTNVLPNPCSHPLCPDCQKKYSESWIKRRTLELLPIDHYYHLVFPLPDNLSIFAMYNKKLIFDTLFHAVSVAMKKVPDEKKIEIAFIAVLQTWASCLWFDPHIHVCFPGIGILKNGKIQEFLSKEYLPFNEEILKKEFKLAFLNKLESHFLNPDLEEYGPVKWPDAMKSIGENKTNFQKWIDELKQIDWEIFISESTYKSPKYLTEYIGKMYPISDDQIIYADENKVVIKGTNEESDVTLKIEDFISRLSKHDMPHNCHRIRNYGFLSNGLKNQKLEQIRNALGAPPQEKKEEENNCCSECQIGKMRTVVWIKENGKIKFFDENIEELKIVPEWLTEIQKVDDIEKVQSVKIYLLNKLFKFPQPQTQNLKQVK